MKLKTAVGLIISTAIVFSSVGVGAAQAAVEGPFFEVGGSRLASGESQEVSGEAGAFIFRFQLATKVECGKSKVIAGSKILGSSGANGGGGEDTLEWSGCRATEPQQCHLSSSVIKSVPLTSHLAYVSASRTGKIEMLLSPTTGKTLATVSFESGCNGFTGAQPMTGSLVTGRISSGGKAIEVGIEPAAASTLVPLFEGSRTVFTESEGKLTEIHPTLTSPLGAVFANGALNMSLSSGSLWGIFS